MGPLAEILVLPFFGQGHLFPCAELCKHLSSLPCKPILILPSHLSSSLPSHVHLNPRIQLHLIPASSPPPQRHHLDTDAAAAADGPRPVPQHHREYGQGIQSFLSERYEDSRNRPAFVVMDVMMCWTKDIFMKANIPVVSFFTTGACATAMEFAAWKGQVENVGLDETRIISGLPECMGLTYSDTVRKRRARPREGHVTPPPNPGMLVRWMKETEGAAALLINTCDDLEGPFLEFLSAQVGKPVFGIGPLLPDTFWKSIGSVVVRDRDNRPSRTANYTEDEVIQWLDSKPSGSVIYVSFGSEVGPTVKEYDELAEALVESGRSFIWVIQPGAGRPGPPPGMFGEDSKSDSEGYEPNGLEERVGKRGLIIKGWAPQLSILSHPSTGGFLSHCGWNSTVEAIGCGVPILGWPIRGDQFYGAKLVADYLKVGRLVANADEVSRMVKKIDIMEGIEGVMGDEEVGKRAAALRGVFEGGFPPTSVESFKGLVQFMTN